MVLGALLKGCCFSLIVQCVRPQSIAIIGAGIGGASSAYYIRQALSGGAGAQITVFEKQARLGGRLEHFTFDNQTLEIGGSILYTGNLHLKQAVEDLGLSRASPPHTGGTYGVWNGTELLFKSSEFKPWTVVKLLWRYGMSLYRLFGVVRESLESFMDIYDCQRDCKSFETSEELWLALGLYNLTQVSLRDYLVQRGVGAADSRLVGELVGAVNRVNYNQGNALNALAGVVSLCPTVTGEIWSVAEGNAAMVKAMIEAADAKLLLGVPVSEVSILRSGTDSSDVKYRLISTDGASLGDFDAVVVATPFALSNLTISEGISEGAGDDGGAGSAWERKDTTDLPPRVYRVTHSTFVEGHMREGYFGPKRAPSSVFLKENTSSPFSSLSLHMQVNETHAVYKLFSSEPLNSNFLDGLFDSWNIMQHRRWLAYPYFHPPEEMASIVPFVGHRIYYVNALETAVSAMEIFTIAAKNIALLLGDSFGHECVVHTASPTLSQDEL